MTKKFEGDTMPKKLAPDGSKNLIGKRVRQLRKNLGLSQEQLIGQLQLLDLDHERGVIKRIENGTRFVSDIEIQILANFFNVSYDFLIDGKECEDNSNKPQE